MDISNFTEAAANVITDASNIAIDNKNEKIGDLHLLKAILNNKDNIVVTIFNKMDLDIDTLTQTVDTVMETIPKVDESKLQFAREVEIALDQAETRAEQFKDVQISLEHIVIGMFENPDEFFKKVIRSLKIDKKAFEEHIKELKASSVKTNIEDEEESDEDKYFYLNKFGRNLTNAARENKLNPVIGRDEEIRNVIRILSRKTKNNPVLIGEPGVGKTAIVEGLANRIIRGDVPTSLKGKTIYELDLGLLIAGAKFKGEFEERLTGILKEIDESQGSIILFIDEIHNIVGAGKSDGAMDASNLLKPKLARGELHCLGATTLDEYREYIEQDPALVRRFQQVLVPEPSVDDAVTILRGIKEKFEIFHGVKIQDSALVAAATLANRYITDRFLPDKAIDLVDEACAMIRSEMESMPAEVDDISRKIMQYEIEEKSLGKEDNPKNKKRIEELHELLPDLRSKYQDMKTRWENEKVNIGKIQKLKEKINDTQVEIETAERNYDVTKAAELKYQTLPSLRALLEQEEKDIEKENGGKSLLKNTVTEEEIGIVISKQTGIPLSKLAEEEKDRLLNLEKVLHERVVGQDEAVKKVSEAILRARAGIANPNRPIGSFLFLGPTGVGKTELGKTLAATLFDDEKSMIRIDMSEYMEKFSVTRLIGAPPGYVGYEEGGQLTEAVRRKPYSVVLFDEVEKAHPDVFNIFLQILDDGRVTDSQGRLIDFKNTVIILTSNLGSQFILESIQKNGEITEEARSQIDALLKSQFRPEFLNRLDEIICFKALDKDVVHGIVLLFLKSVSSRIKSKGIDLSFTDESVDWLIEEGYDMEFGARPLKRIVQSQVETMIAHKIIAGDIKEGDKVEVYFDKEIDGLNIRPKENSLPVSEDSEINDENKEEDKLKEEPKNESKEKGYKILETKREKLPDGTEVIKRVILTEDGRKVVKKKVIKNRK